jgi:ATP-dependent DNA helicase DinG
MIDIPEHPPVPQFWDDVTSILTDMVPGYRQRTQQDELVAHMWDSLRGRRHSAVEAAVGTGKSYAALAVANQLPGRVVISTATKALQNQYRENDIPALERVGVLARGDAVVLQGRGNWLCLQRAEQERKHTTQPAAKKVLRLVLEEFKAEPGHDGARDRLATGVPDWLWSRICSEPDACRNTCKPPTCSYTAARERARSARIVIVNHHVLLADASIKRMSGVAWGRKSADPDEKEKPSVLGPYRYLIVDEAHALEPAAESFGERRVTVRGVQTLATRIGKLTYSGAATSALADCAVEISTVAKSLPQGCLLEAVDDGPILLDAAKYAKEAARSTRNAGDNEQVSDELAGACNNLHDRLEAIDKALRFGADDLGDRAPSTEKGAITSQLVDAGPWLKENLFDQVPTVLMSGTLTVPGRRGYVPTRIGLGGVEVEKLGTVFNLAEQRLVYVTPRADEGGGARVGDADVEELRGLLDASNGRALVLFSANIDLRYVYDRIHSVTEHRLLAQGITPADDLPTGRRRTADQAVMPNAKLAKLFHEDTHSILLATRSFFEGVDFAGDTCSLVVIVRYPNLRPDDPLTLARRRVIERRGGNSWVEYQEPAMQMIFSQAAGRAIRRTDDYGVVAVLDPRSGSKAYARRALTSLVPSDFTDSLDDVEKFLTPR